MVTCDYCKRRCNDRSQEMCAGCGAPLPKAEELPVFPPVSIPFVQSQPQEIVYGKITSVNTANWEYHPMIYTNGTYFDSGNVSVSMLNG